MPGPQHAIVGEDYGTNLPEMQVPEESMTEEKKSAKYARSHEYKKLVAHWEATKRKYQVLLPDGTPVNQSGLSLEELGKQWLVANSIIAELDNVMNYYETAKEAVGDAESV